MLQSFFKTGLFGYIRSNLFTVKLEAVIYSQQINNYFVYKNISFKDENEIKQAWWSLKIITF